MEIKEISKIYKALAGEEPVKVELLPGAGSSRCYYRIYTSAGKSLIATEANNKRDNISFRSLSKILKEEGCRVPEILYYSDEFPTIYFQSDHGDVALMTLIEKWQKNSIDPEVYNEMMQALRDSIDALIEIQTCSRISEVSQDIEPPLSALQIGWDLNYFKYDFLKPAGVEFDEYTLQADFDNLTQNIINFGKSLWGFMYRDFQSRNIMVDSSGVTLIDFQGGRFGPVLYDMVSLLWQAKARFTSEIRQELIDYYIERYSDAVGRDVRRDALQVLPYLKVFRTLQVLGAYGFRGLIQRKVHFIESIPFALSNLKELITAGGFEGLPELESCCRRLVEMQKRFQPNDTDRLRVEVFSFSYKKGYPEDFSGNGGGFMFDCRGMHNPGRYEEYKKLTGLDEPVIIFLEKRGEVQKFLDAAIQMVEPTVACYIRRRFKNLQVAFGCTGGRHRSVYCAQHLADYLAEKFPEIEIKLLHREQSIRQNYVEGRKSDPNLIGDKNYCS